MAPFYPVEERLFINGEFVPSISGRKFNIYNPATEQLSASIYEADANDVDVAVKAAQEALPSWSALSASERGAYLFQLADAMERAMPEIRYLEAISMGRPVHSLMKAMQMIIKGQSHSNSLLLLSTLAPPIY
ncbi:hypothetical protein MPH_12404 [Macrophomina phaseolina MS6]|uniref:aldehyde dehydrogenase (NAD(+)) n=1 Tax=Macrophomina phaseolina (strain MS6) TaxID=1126212 RepID=K2QL88_MACPH|nr:hypothetical protein MPH_12404 [Macrophomina phaseolina MS6]